ncbi:Serine/threonine-protein kinase ULK1 [Tetrabaena socialis]|uniref:Serine/threonine-protein kinase ULK1 n=1 Tax=Tetrabaena socialis TaxID=47790 RepID=A0A2J8AA91_9CHLO|nr:Serine/threonine-protein kinase ULK1 [Tetrabaena socialis]|eukprot:PNH09437.1 Serine/threonine-protein kinase ULK1 [Tetrabaena socialis]
MSDIVIARATLPAPGPFPRAGRASTVPAPTGVKASATDAALLPQHPPSVTKLLRPSTPLQKVTSARPRPTAPQLTVRELLSYGDQTLPAAIISIIPDMGRPAYGIGAGAVLPPADVQTLSGCGSELPPEMAPLDDTGTSFSRYTMITWWQAAVQLQAEGPAIALAPGQQLSLASLSLDLVDVPRPFGVFPTLPNLALPALLRVPVGASLQLTDVVIVVSVADLLELMRSICSPQGTDAWSYNPDVTVDDESTYLLDYTSRAPSENGVAGEGGEVHWSNVQIVSAGFPNSPPPLPLPCAALTVSFAWQLGVDGLHTMLESVEGPIYLSLVTDLALLQEGSARGYEQVVVPPGRLLVLLGDPSLEQQRGRRTTLDLGGLEGAWLAPQGARFRDLQLVNLPYSSSPLEPYDLLAVGMHSFRRPEIRTTSGSSVAPSAQLPNLRLAYCTLVVSDPELAFLSRAAAASASGVGIPDLATLFGNDVRQPHVGGDPTADQSEGRLVLEYLQISSLVALSNMTLLSASAYSKQLAIAAERAPPLAPPASPAENAPPASAAEYVLPLVAATEEAPPPAPLLPSVLVWPPLSLHDEEVALQWGGSGTVAATGLMDALLRVPVCASTPSHRTVLLLPSDPDPLSMSPLAAVEPQPVPVDGGRSPLSAAEECVVAGYPPALAGRRTFVNMQGAIGRVALSSPITLRDLVLYNLAPGGSYPTEGAGRGGDGPLAPPAQLTGADAVWTNSSLPLWFFQCARADEDLQQLLLSSGDQAGAGIAFPGGPPRRLALVRVTLVVPEAEWRALSAAVLLQHAPYSMQAAHQDEPRRRQLRRYRRRLAEAGKAPEVQAGASATDALLGFAAASRVASYNFTSGVLVLAEARWYGVHGSEVTVTYKLPDDAPQDATLLPYSGLVLPYQELADLDINVSADFSPPPPAPPLPPSLPPSTPSPPTSSSNISQASSGWLGPPSSNDGVPPAPQPGHPPLGSLPSQPVLLPQASAPSLVPLPSGAHQSQHGPMSQPPPNGPPPQPWVPPPPAERSPQLLPVGVGEEVRSGGGRPGWHVPVVALVSAVGGVAFLAAAVWGLLARRRLHGLREGSAEGLVPAARPTKAGLFLALAPGGAVGLSSSPRAAGCSALAMAPGGSSSAITSATNAGSTAQPPPSSHQGSGALASPPAVCALSAEGISGATFSGPALSGLTSDLKATLEVGFRPPDSEEEAASKQDFVQALDVYFGVLRDSLECGIDPQQQELLAQPDGHGNANPRLRAYRRTQGPLKDGAELSHAIRTLEAELRDPDLTVKVFLGRGACGMVFGGSWRGLPVAVKMLVVPGLPAATAAALGPDGGGSDKDIRTRQRAVLEAAISLSMAHPNVVATYTYELKPLVHNPQTGGPFVKDSACAGDNAESTDADAYKLYIVQELCNGDSLGNALSAGMAGSFLSSGIHRRLALRLAADVALGMAHVHSCRIVHGDLKPDNVLLVCGPRHKRKDGGGAAPPESILEPGQPALRLTAKVADFGLSLPLEAGATHASHRFQGTPLYSAPEVLLEGRQSPQADAWSFGLILVELFYGCTLSKMRGLHGVHWSAQQTNVTAVAGDPQRRSLQEILMEEMFNSPYRSYAALTSSCLRMDSHSRPTFEELAVRLLEMCQFHVRNQEAVAVVRQGEAPAAVRARWWAPAAVRARWPRPIAPQMTVRELLSYGDQPLPEAIISIIPDMGRPAYGIGAGAVFPPADVQTLLGQGWDLPPEMAFIDGTAASFSRYTMITWWQVAVQLQAEGPAVALAPGQQLSLTTLSLDLMDVPRPFGVFPTLPNLALSALFRVPVGASLQLSNVVIVVSVADLLELIRSVCSPQDTDAWRYNPGVVIDDSSVDLLNYTSRAPSENGVAGEGGEVHWFNVQLVPQGFPDSPLPLPCAAFPVSFASQLAEDGLHTMLESVGGPIYLSLVADLALQDGPAEQVVVPPGRLLVLLGDPSSEQRRGRRTTLDLGGLEGAWLAPQGARLRDLQLVNLPYSSSPLEPYDLLAVGMQSFSRPGAGTTSGSSVAPSAQLPSLRLAYCTLVVSDPELAFLSRAAVASASGIGVPDLSTLFGADVPQPRVSGDPTADSSEGRLVLEYLQISSLVVLSNTTLLSASAYSKQLAIAAERAPPPAPPASPAEAAPPANAAEDAPPAAGMAPLLPSSLTWPPLSLYDEEVALQWGGSGTVVATGLMDALQRVPACASTPSHRTVLLLPSDPDQLSVSPLTTIGPQPALVDGGRSPLSAAEECVVAGYPPALAGRRTFVNMQDAIGRVVLSSPITLRDLVLYNLGPGGAYPTLGSSGGDAGPLAPAPQLTGADAVWTNSSLPLWLFQCARADEDLQQLLVSSGGQAGAGAALPGGPAPRLALVRVTLVVPEAEWRALAAAVLLQHAPYSMQAAQRASATAALLGFAAASRAVSYNYSGGVLVLAEARWYGVHGSDVTVTYKLPDDAPPDATLLPYSGLVLPYQELASAPLLVPLPLDAHQLQYGPMPQPPPNGLPPQPQELQPPAERSPQLLPAGVGAEDYFGALSDSLECDTDPQQQELLVQPDGHGNATPRLRAYRRKRGSLKDGAELSHAIRRLEVELRDPDLTVKVFLGRGACGMVFGGTWRGLPVAVKVLVVPELPATTAAALGPDGGGGGGGDIHARQRAVLEAAISLSMAHPNVVATYTYELKPLVHNPQTAGPSMKGSTCAGDGAESTDADAYKLYIVQELCNGGSLGNALSAGMAGSIVGSSIHRRLALRLAADVALGMAHVNSCRIVHGDLKPGAGMAGSIVGSSIHRRLALRLAADVALGMAHVNSCRIVHGDLKPDNVLLMCGPRRKHKNAGEEAPAEPVREPEEPALRLTAKVADFGLSLPLEVGATHASCRFQGTPLYSAPEVLLEGRQSPQADAWSFGLILVELFYGCTLPTICGLHGVQLGTQQTKAAAAAGDAQRRSLQEILIERESGVIINPTQQPGVAKAIISIIPDMGRPAYGIGAGAVFPPADVQALLGQGWDLPPEMAFIDGTAASFSRYTMITWWQVAVQLQAEGPAVALAPALFRVPVGASLQLSSVVIVVSVADLLELMRSVCSPQDTDAWRYNPGVVIDDSSVNLINYTSRAPSENGVVGEGDLALLQDGSARGYEQVVVPPGRLLVLLGDPSLEQQRGRRTTLDLGGQEGAWFALQGARLRDLQLVNLPYSSSPLEPYDLLAVGMQSFSRPGDKTTSGSSVAPSAQLPSLRLAYCTLVVSDPEVAFLSRAAVASASGVGVPDLSTLFGADVPQPRVGGDPTADQSEGRLVLEYLQISSLVVLSSTTLLSASAYSDQLAIAAERVPPPAPPASPTKDAPPANVAKDVLLLDAATEEAPPPAPLLPSALMWPPLSLYDEEVALQWGGSGTVAATGLMDALLRVPACASTPSHRTVLLLPSDPDPLSVSPLAAVEPQPVLVDGGRSPLSAAEECVVAGYPAALAGRRTFVNMQGAIGRVALSSPITLRDLVLYNLAPGGTYPAEGTSRGGDGPLVPAAQLAGADAVWTNSSLPLWLFQCARADEDLQQLLVSSGGQAVVGTALPGGPPPRLALVRVTLVVPEAEWRALAAAVLLQHAPYSMQAPQHEPRRRRRRHRRRLGEAGEAPEGQAGASASAALLGFAAASRAASYNYSGGVLVLAEARWYGVHGSDVTVTYKLPDDAPPDATLLPYSGLALPYQELADLDINVSADFSPPPPAPPRPPSLPPSTPSSLTLSSNISQAFSGWLGPPSSNDGAPPAPQPSHPPLGPLPSQPLPLPQASAPLLVPLLPDAHQSQPPPNGPLPQPWAPQPPAERSPGLLSAGIGAEVRADGGRPAWHVPVIALVSAVGGVAVLAAAVWGLLAGRRQHGLREGSADGIAPAAPPTKAGLFLALAPGGAVGPSSSPRAAGCSALATAAGGSSSATLPATNAGSITHPSPSSYQGSGALASPPAVCALPAEGTSGATFSGPELSGLTSDLKTTLEVGFRLPDTVEDEASKRDFLQAHNDYFGVLRDSLECDTDPQQQELLVQPDGHGNATPRLRAYRGKQGSLEDGAELLHAIRRLEVELRDPDLAVNVVLGRGAFGMVFGGMWRGLPVAVKVLVVPELPATTAAALGQGGGGGDIHARQRAVLEAAISLSMAHPNVVATYTYELKPLVHNPQTAGPSMKGSTCAGDGAESTDADAYKLYIVQELCNGGSLGNALNNVLLMCGPRRKHKNAGDEAPPEPILESGESALRLTAKVADFGLSLPLEVGATHASRRFQGTPLYSAPEVLLEGRQSPQADAWSFGLILVELFYGCTLPTICGLHGVQLGTQQTKAAAAAGAAQRRSLQEILIELSRGPKNGATGLSAMSGPSAKANSPDRDGSPSRGQSSASARPQLKNARVKRERWMEGRASSGLHGGAGKSARMTVRELLSYGDPLLPEAIISIVPDVGRPAHGIGAGAVFPPADVQTLSGCGSELPPETFIVGPVASFTRYTMITWWQAAVQLQAEGPAIALAPGQQLILENLSLDLTDVPRPFGVFPTLPNLALSALFRVPVGASLQLSHVVIVVSVADLLELTRSVCAPQDTDAWRYNPGVAIDDSRLNLLNYTSRAPSENGVAGEGGEVLWNNVRLVPRGFPGSPLPLPCAAFPVSFASQLAEDGLHTLLEGVGGPIYLSLVTDLALQGGPAEQVVVPPGRLLVLLGDPSSEQRRGRRTTLDLGGLEGAWLAPQGARLRDLQLVNLPYSSSPLEPYDLLAVGMQSFSRPGDKTTSGSSVAPSAQLPSLRLAYCTLVVSDPEVAFLSRAAVASAGGVGVPDLATLFGADVPQPRVGGDPTADSSEGRLVLEYLQISSLVALSNATLLSASAYSNQLAIAAKGAPPPAPPASPAEDAPPTNAAEDAPPAAGMAPLLPSALVWPPLSLYDEEVALQWGGSGTVVATGLMDALQRVPACASTPSHRTVLLLPSDSDLLSVSPLAAVEPQPVLVDGDRSPLSAAEECVVAGYPPALAGRRTFVNMQGAIGRVALSSPITLRDLVLYNLAPGGAYPTLGSSGGDAGPLAPAPQLTGADAVWTNSSLPLWLFQCARSDEDLQQLLISSGGQAGAGTALPGGPPPRLALVRVTLVVPEAEWRALAAAVLLQHAPYSMQAAQQDPRRRRLRRYRRLLEEAGEAPEVQAGTFDWGRQASNAPFRTLFSTRLLPAAGASATAALLGFAAASRAVSYNYSGGVLVLAEARWYGVHGSDVTVTYKLPGDAPPDATLLPYSGLVLPYQELADLDIDVAADFSPPPPAPPLPPSLPPSTPSLPTSSSNISQAFSGWFGPPSSNDGAPPAPQPSHPPLGPLPSQPLPLPQASAPLLVPLPPDAHQSQHGMLPPAPPDGPPPQPQEPQPPAERSSGLLPAGIGAEVRTDGGGQPGWHVPVVALVSAVGGVAVLAAAVWGLLAWRRQHRLRESSADGVAPAAKQGTKAGLFLALAPGGSSFGRSALATAAGGPSSTITSATNAGSITQPPPSSYQGSGALASPPAVCALPAEGTSGATFSGPELSGLTSDLKTTLEVGFRPPNMEEEEASKQDFVQAHNEYFGVLRDSLECSIDPQQQELLAEAAGHGNATPRLRAYRRKWGSLKDGAGLSHAIRRLEVELRDPDLAVNVVLGRGACGMVFGGTWRGLPVAVKVLVVPELPATTAGALGPDGGGGDIHARQRAVLEAAISLSMAHPNVVATYTYELKPLVHNPQTGGPLVKGSTCAGDGAVSTDADAYKLYIVQELCNGDSLGNALSTWDLPSGAGMAGSIVGSGIHRRLALRLAADVALGMAHVHSCRIVHGDLKPDNVLLMCGPRRKHKNAGEEAPAEPVREPEEPALRLTAKVADFGLSLPLEAGATHASRRFQGTPLYSAPEVLLEGRQSPQADTWSFGLILVELFYGCTLPTMCDLHGVQLSTQQTKAAAAAGDAQRRSLQEILMEEMSNSPYRSYAALTSSCLRMDSHSRPTFEQLAARLLEMCDDGKEGRG